ncbi:MAG: class I SAM-dependent methyltransferase [Bacteroidota bacterium]
MNSSDFTQEIKSGKRFQFGKNWKAFLNSLTNEHIEIAVSSLSEMLGEIKGKSFLDIGCGSGLFSLSAKKMGAHVHSFDYDTQSYQCTKELKKKYFPTDSNWIIEQNSILNREYLQSLGQFDIVYSWGVLHHSGKMWEAIENVCPLVKKNGKLFIAIYNDQGIQSRFWKIIKKYYNKNIAGKILISIVFIPMYFMKAIIKGTVRYGNPLAEITHYRKNRGMNIWHDWIDWLGGYPFEVATHEQIIDFFISKNFVSEKIKTTTTLGCNEFVFIKTQK